MSYHDKIGNNLTKQANKERSIANAKKVTPVAKSKAKKVTPVAVKSNIKTK